MHVFRIYLLGKVSLAFSPELHPEASFVAIDADLDYLLTRHKN